MGQEEHITQPGGDGAPLTLAVQLTAVTLSVTKVTTDHILRPEGVAGALFADWITLATP